MWEICEVQPFLLLPTVLDLRLLFRKLFMVGPYLLSLRDAGIVLQGLIAQVIHYQFTNASLMVQDWFIMDIGLCGALFRPCCV